MKVFWVIGWDLYYPNSDNFQASFATREEAVEYIASLNDKAGWERCDYYAIIDISNRL